MREGDLREISSFLIDGGADDWDRKHRDKEFVTVLVFDMMTLWALGSLLLPVQELLYMDIDPGFTEAHTNF